MENDTEAVAEQVSHPTEPQPDNYRPDVYCYDHLIYKEKTALGTYRCNLCLYDAYDGGGTDE